MSQVKVDNTGSQTTTTSGCLFLLLVLQAERCAAGGSVPLKPMGFT